ncbi:MAG: LLM class flavin-dependent oxidoreductase [Chloroflexia bacterium]
MPQSLRFGISLPNRAVLFGLPPETLLVTAERAEASGLFDSVWVGDNFLSKPRLEAVVALSAVAARTKRLKLGTICLASFPLRHPLPFAIQWASLDVLSGGRTILVVCNGGSVKMGGAFATELVAMGVKSSERPARVEEGIAILRRFFGPDPVTFHGQFYDFEEVQVLPKPVQARVPIGIAVKPIAGDPVGGAHPAARRATGRLLADGQHRPGDLQGLVGTRAGLRRQYGREVPDAQLHLMVNINDDGAGAAGVGGVPGALLRPGPDLGRLPRALAGLRLASGGRGEDPDLHRRGVHHAGAALHVARSAQAAGAVLRRYCRSFGSLWCDGAAQRYNRAGVIK